MLVYLPRMKHPLKPNKAGHSACLVFHLSSIIPLNRDSCPLATFPFAPSSTSAYLPAFPCSGALPSTSAYSPSSLQLPLHRAVDLCQDERNPSLRPVNRFPGPSVVRADGSLRGPAWRWRRSLPSGLWHVQLNGSHHDHFRHKTDEEIRRQDKDLWTSKITSSCW